MSQPRVETRPSSINAPSKASLEKKNQSAQSGNAVSLGLHQRRQETQVHSHMEDVPSQFSISNNLQNQSQFSKNSNLDRAFIHYSDDEDINGNEVSNLNSMPSPCVSKIGVNTTDTTKGFILERKKSNFSFASNSSARFSDDYGADDPILSNSELLSEESQSQNIRLSECSDSCREMIQGLSPLFKASNKKSSRKNQASENSIFLRRSPRFNNIVHFAGTAQSVNRDAQEEKDESERDMSKNMSIQSDSESQSNALNQTDQHQMERSNIVGALGSDSSNLQKRQSESDHSIDIECRKPDSVLGGQKALNPENSTSNIGSIQHSIFNGNMMTRKSKKKLPEEQTNNKGAYCFQSNGQQFAPSSKLKKISKRNNRY